MAEALDGLGTQFRRQLHGLNRIVKSLQLCQIWVFAWNSIRNCRTHDMEEQHLNDYVTQ